VQEGNVAVADDPFGSLSKAREVDPVNDAAEAISPTATEDGCYFRVVELLLQVVEPGFIAAGKIIVRVAAEGAAGFYLVAPLPEGIDTGLSSFEGHITGGTDDGDGIAGAQGWGDVSHRIKIEDTPLFEQGIHGYFLLDKACIAIAIFYAIGRNKGQKECFPGFGRIPENIQFILQFFRVIFSDLERIDREFHLANIDALILPVDQ
jgi:hypothetical protein